MTELTVVLPLPPNLANSRMHWRVKNKARRHYLGYCELWVASNRQWTPRIDASAKRQVAFTVYLGARMDHDNALSRMKWPLDFLVSRGYLVDDSPQYCDMSIPEQVITRDKSKQRVEITISYEDAEIQLPSLQHRELDP